MLLSLVCWSLMAAPALCSVELKELFSWKTLNYAVTKEQRMEIPSGSYRPYNNVPTSFALSKDRLFIAVPRIQEGVISTLNFVKIPELIEGRRKPSSPCLIPYPNLATNTDGNHNLTSVFTVRVDKCNTLWAVDTGRAPGQIAQKPKLLQYDLKSDVLKDEATIDAAQENAIFGNIAVDNIGTQCTEAFVYIADMVNHQLFVHHWNHGHSAEKMNRIISKNFEPTDFSRIGKHRFRYGLFGISLDAKNAYLSPMSSSKLYETKKDGLYTNPQPTYHLLGDKGPSSQTATTVIREGIMFSAQLSESSVKCWNVTETLSRNTLKTVAEDKHRMVFPADIIVDDQWRLWILSAVDPVYLKKSVNPYQTNFRVLMGYIEEVDGTRCSSTSLRGPVLVVLSSFLLTALEAVWV